MLTISEQDIWERLKVENPWWSVSDFQKMVYQDFPLRDYFNDFFVLVTQKNVHRAVIMMGPRRVGKTVILYQSIYRLLASGVNPQQIFFVSLDTPMFVNMPLEKLYELYLHHHQIQEDQAAYVFFDEIQYLKNWEIHLKNIVDKNRHIKFVASGSAAAALRRKSQESGAGRFTDFILPPLTFAEYLRLKKVEDQLIFTQPGHSTHQYFARDIHELNRYFTDYVNYGGYPEVALSQEIQINLERYVSEDIIGKVLLRDLPSIYGISDIQELNRLFTVLAYNTGNEVNLDELSKNSGVSKPTLSRYLEYLEAAFLIVQVRRIDDNARHFQKQRQFKVYLINPCMRAALFTPVDRDNPDPTIMGMLAETAIFSQWFHSKQMKTIHYARWKRGEVDIVGLDDHQLTPKWAYEIKWSDAYFDHPEELKGLIYFGKKNNLSHIGTSTKTKEGLSKTKSGMTIKQFPCSLHCYRISKDFVR